MNTQSFSLDLRKNPVPVPVLYLGQGDVNGTNINVSITDNGEAFDLTAYAVKLCIRQPLANGYYEVDGTVAGNVASFTIDETYGATTPGVTDTAYVNIIDGDTVIASTARFQCVILPNATYGIDPTRAYTNGIAEFLEESEAEFDEKIAEVDAAIEAIGEISVLAVPLMSATTRGGAKLGSGLYIEDGALCSGAAQPIFPFFEADVSDTHYFESIHAAYSNSTLGWGEYLNTNSSGGAYRYIYCTASPYLKEGQDYTLLVEIKNATSTGDYGKFRLLNPAEVQLGTGTDFATLSDGRFVIPITAKSDFSACTRLIALRYHQQANCTTSFRIRISLFEGAYDGEWMPYRPTFEESRALLTQSALLGNPLRSILQPDMTLGDEEVSE